MPVGLLTFLHNPVFCPPFQAFWGECEPRGKVLTAIRIGQLSPWFSELAPFWLACPATSGIW